MPPLQLKEKDLNPAFEASYINGADQLLLAYATPRCKRGIEGNVD